MGDVLELNKQVITDKEIEEIMSLQVQSDQLKSHLEHVQEKMRDLENCVIHKIDAGAQVTGSFYALQVQKIERRYPAWKEHFIALAGKAAAEDIAERTEPKVYRTLKIKQWRFAG